MIKKVIIAAVIAAGFISTGCTDASRSDLGSYVTGANSHIQCFSGGQIILDDVSTGYVEIDSSGNGVYYRSEHTHRKVHTYADCIVTVE